MSGCHHHHHDHADRTGWTVALNLTVNLGLTAAKWVAYALTGSPSLFGEATHSTADSLNPIFQWIGHRRGQRPACANHPHGHGRETYFWSLLAALVMLVLGAGFTAWHGLKTMITGEAPERSVVSLIIMAVALVAEGYTFFRAWRELKREGASFWQRLRHSRNTVLLGILLENFVDTIGVVLAFAGFGLFWVTGNPYFDAAFSLAIAATITASAFFLIRRNRSLLVGESLSATELTRIREVVEKQRWVQGVPRLTAVAEGQQRVSCVIVIKADRHAFGLKWRGFGQLSPFGLTDLVLEAQHLNVALLKRELQEVDPRLHDINIEIH